MTEHRDEIDQKILNSFSKTMLKECYIRRIFEGERFLHDLNIHPDTIEEVLIQIINDFGIDASGFNINHYVFKFGGIDDFISPFRRFNRVKLYFENRYKIIDIDFLRQSIITRRMPPH